MYYFRRLALLGVVVGVSLFLTGCFDLSMVMNVAQVDGQHQVGTLMTMSTPHEDVAEFFKAMVEEEQAMEGDELDDPIPTYSEKDGIYSIQWEEQLQDFDPSELEIKEEENYLSYTFREITLSGPEDDEVIFGDEEFFDEDEAYEEDDLDFDDDYDDEELSMDEWDEAALFEGHVYTFTINFPQRIQQIWWIDHEDEILEEADADMIEENTFSFQAPMKEVMGLGGEVWANRFGVIVHTDLP